MQEKTLVAHVACRCPHLLVQIRSLGLVEICGKNHGGQLFKSEDMPESPLHCRGLSSC